MAAMRGSVCFTASPVAGVDTLAPYNLSKATPLVEGAIKETDPVLKNERTRGKPLSRNSVTEPRASASGI